MKHLVTTIIILVALIGNAQTIKPGDNLKTEFKKLAAPYYSPASGFTAWREGAKLLLIGDKPNPNECEFVFMALKDTTLIGVLKNTKPVSFMFDTIGTSILSNPTSYFVLPEWTVKKKTKIISSDKMVLSLLDKMYEKTLQADELELDQKTMEEYVSYQVDTSLSNRHIMLLFDNYQTIITETAAKGKEAPAEICVPLMRALSKECLSLYKVIPVIVCIYMGEALHSAGMMDEARQHFKRSLQLYPNSIPLQVYNYRLEQDPVKKKEQLATLKKKYAGHWMVKDL